MQTKSPTNSYRDGWERIFGNKEPVPIQHIVDEDAHTYTEDATWDDWTIVDWNGEEQSEQYLIDELRYYLNAEEYEEAEAIIALLERDAMSQLKDLVKDQQVHFDFYRQKEIWYKTDSGFSFPVPIEDAGDGIFLRDDKAILFMRYIRKQLASIDAGKKETQQAVEGDARAKVEEDYPFGGSDFPTE